MGGVVKFPWENLPARQIENIAEQTARTVALLQQDMAYAVAYTAILVHSNRPELQMLVNTQRGQIIPRGVCKFSGGATVEFQDIGMPQVGAPQMTVKELMTWVWGTARELGLEME